MTAKGPLARVDPQLKRQLRKRVVEGRHSVTENTAFLTERGADVSRSAVGRFSRLVQEQMGEQEELIQAAAAMGRKLEELPEADLHRLANDMLGAKLLRVIMQIKADDEPDPKLLMVASRVHQQLVLANKRNIEAEITVREQTKALKAVKDVAAERGLSSEVVDTIRARILGIRETHGASAAQG